MAKNLSSILAQVRAVLRDEAAEGVTNDFTDDEVMAHLDQALTEISAQSPAESRETLTATPGSRELSVAAVTGLLDVEKAEYPAGEDPPKYRNVTLFGTTMTLDVDAAPTSAAPVYAYCRRAHSLTETSSTLKPTEERLLVDGTAAYTALAYAATVREQVKLALDKQTEIGTAVSSMTARLTQAGTDLTSALASVDAMTARITQALSDLTSGRTPVAAIEDRLTQAQADLASARTRLAGASTDLDTDLGSIAARITQALADLTSGRALVNTITVGANPVSEYAGLAAHELQTANEYLAQARIHLSEGGIASGYNSTAAHEMQSASVYRAQGEAYGSIAARELQTAQAFAAQSSQYGADAQRQMSLANTYLAQASGHIRQATARLQALGPLNAYQSWAQNKLLLYKRELARLAKPRIQQRYPTN